MKKNHLIPAFLFFALSLVACSDSSSNADDTAHYILDEKNQTIGFIYDRCYVTENFVRWDSFVDTIFYKYDWVDDYLLLFKTKSTADPTADYDPNPEYPNSILSGGKHGNIYGKWIFNYRAYYSDGKVKIEEGDEEDDEEYAYGYLNVSKSDVSMNFKLNPKACPVEDAIYLIDDYLGGIESFDINTDCKSGVMAYGVFDAVHVTAEISLVDNAFSETYTYKNGDKSCVYDYTRVDDEIQMSQSLCNTTDMARYMSRASDGGRYVYGYRNEFDEDDFVECISDLFGVEMD
ncbi:MAG: hypothetical protein HUK19_01480 [Fibrobacter sp.]|nr:hypothetical protein [Fibrobacter sp.]